LKSFVWDASAALKWMLPAKDEPLRQQAYQLLDEYGAGELHLLVPEIFWAECGNVVWKAVRQHRFDHDAAKVSISWLLARNLPTVPSLGLLHRAVTIAFDFHWAVYDALYVALASQAKVDLITADERLANALAAHFPVKWLGSL
jgi:predicted nucleic acid-binding protein